jgi:HlyD family secretion protein
VKKRLILVIFLVLLLGVGALVYFGQYRHRHTGLYYSGTIEAATDADLAFQVSGGVKEVLVDEGQAATKGQLLAILRQEEFKARQAMADAEVRQAQEKLKQLQSVLELERNVLPAEVEKAQAAVRSLESQLAELEAGYRDRDVEQARLAYQQARFAREEARKNKVRTDALYQKRIIAERDKDASDLKFETADKEYNRAKQAYEQMKEGYRKEAIESARSRVAEGQAVLKQARSNLKKIETTERQIDAAKAQVQAAEAALELVRIQLDYTELRAPFNGILVSRNVEPGEVVSPGREVLSLADLSKVKLKIFVDETEIGKIKPGQEADVKIDTFPDKVYTGHVSFISPEGEFTPKIIQTRKERVKLVYLVKITIVNPNYELKPGMPADAWFK